MNETILRFGYPTTLIKEYNWWMILLRANQITIGSLMLVYKPGVESLSEVSQEGFAELGIITKKIETVLSCLFGMEKINYLALMMVDKNVHFHVIPRYSTKVDFNNKIFVDSGWPNLPDFSFNNEISNLENIVLKETIVNSFK